MKKYVAIAFLIFCINNYGIAQKKSTQKSKNKVTKKAVTKKPKKTTQNVAIQNSLKTPALDSLPIKPLVNSMENDGVFSRLLNNEQVPLEYEHIREDDVLYKQRVWRIIDVREKMNQPFAYDADENSGNQQFISVLLSGIQTGKITSVYESVDDRFTTQMDKAAIRKSLIGDSIKTTITDWVKDPTGQTQKDTILFNEFSPDMVKRYEIKEDWVFDKESSRMHVRILGIAPLLYVTSPETGEIIGEKKLFWIYYPKARNYLANVQAYNPKNIGARLSWENLLENRMFSSTIVKSTLDNFSNSYIANTKGLKGNGILQLWEGENIKKKIFDYEQNLWAY